MKRSKDLLMRNKELFKNSKKNFFNNKMVLIPVEMETEEITDIKIDLAVSTIRIRRTFQTYQRTDCLTLGL